MNRKSISSIFLLLIFSFTITQAQQKRALNHKDYDGWESVVGEKLSKTGKWVGFEVTPQEGDGRLEIVSSSGQANHFVIPRGSKVFFSSNEQFAVGKISPQSNAVKQQKLKKVKQDDLHKDSLFVMNLSNGEMEKFSRVKSYALPAKSANWLAIHFEKDLQRKDIPKAQTDSLEKKPADKPRKTDGTRLLVKSLESDQKFEFNRVKTYEFDESGRFIYYVKATEDTLKNAGIFILDLQTGISKIIDVKKSDYLAPAFSPNGKYLAYLTTEDSLKAKKPYYDIFLYEIEKGTGTKVATKNSAGMQGRVSKNGKLMFTADESRLLFGTAPAYRSYTYEEDSTILDEDRVKIDIWGWQDNEIQPMQLKNKARNETKTFLHTYLIKEKKIIPIADEKVQDIILDRKIRHKIALGSDDKPYRRNYSWDIQIGSDLYLVNLENGSRSLLKQGAPNSAKLSPDAKYVYWYSLQDSSWVVYDLAAKVERNMTKGYGVNFYEELHDSPALPESYGAAGWLAEDKGLLVYDKYDIWKLDPTGKSDPVNLTLGEGRRQKIVFRREKLDEEELFIPANATLWLSAFSETDKRSGYYEANVSGTTAPQPLIFSDHRYFGLKKAEESEKILFRRSTFIDAPDLFVAEGNFENPLKLSLINPQQKDVVWGSVELIDFLANDGTPLQGLLFKPENFNPAEKYPLMVYFYERNSDGLHSYRPPAPSASTINITYFVSNGYMVFVPDIKYDLGLPGPSAYNCIIPGVQAVVAKGNVDTQNMAIQGQSWGGYQVAYLITQTNMFKAAGAGAPVVNMTSAYGGIRWGTGMSRMFQYEQTQSRIGGTLWEKPMHYLENSPLFYMDRVKTPVLIMHNDADGAVPWYQGIEMFMALKRLNQPAWLLQYNGEDHNLRERKNRKDLSVRLSQFFDHYLKGAPQPLWMTEGLPATEKGRTLKYELMDEEN
jgi:dipeptidyl aminopeptidase/acylaminoacyl peptidase